MTFSGEIYENNKVRSGQGGGWDRHDLTLTFGGATDTRVKQRGVFPGTELCMTGYLETVETIITINISYYPSFVPLSAL